MKIVDSSVALTSSHRAYASQTSEVTVQTGFSSIFNDMSVQSADRQAALRQRAAEILDSMLSTILAALEGKKCLENVADASTPGVAAEAPASPAGGQRQLSWQVTTTVSRRECETTRVCGRGTVRTADGREIGFEVGLDMARQHFETQRLDAAGNVILKDPLVINFAGQACQLTEQRIDFDLEGDGTAESLPGLAATSGYLVFDRNGNGVADDGRELFGTKSGDGFADLAALDDDGNGWVDEADAAFARLQVWSGGKYASLAERGVGALYTGQVDSPFTLKTADNRLLGEIRAAGIYLDESGRAGTLQQVDLAVSAPAQVDQQPEHGQHLAAEDHAKGRLEGRLG